MSDKYNSLSSDIFLNSTYQMLVNPRNKRLEKEGAINYFVCDSYFVERNGMKKCNQMFYDTAEWCVQTDLSDDDRWACVTSDLINTFNTLSTNDKH